MIVVEDLHKKFDGRQVLDGVSLRVEKGELLAVIGASGQGKSVLLKNITGLMKPDRGRVLIDGHEIGRLGTGRLTRLRQRFGFIFQNGALFDSMTVYDNVAFPLRETLKLAEPECERRVLRELEQVGLSDARSKLPAQLSGGMMRRTALARALVGEPEFMLFDEPTTGLDPMIKHAMLELIKSCHQRLGFTGILVSHDVPEVFDIVQKVAMLHDGVIRFFGTPDEIMATENPFVRQFVRAEVQGPIDLL